MPDPATTSGAAVIGLSATGVTLFGLALGLRPELVLAGLWGAFWALSYAAPMPLHRRCTLSVTASILAGYGTPAAMAVVDGMGLGIGPLPTLSWDLQLGRIVAPFPKVQVVGSSYHALVPLDSDKPHHSQDFVKWLVEAAREAPRCL